MEPVDDPPTERDAEGVESGRKDSSGDRPHDVDVGASDGSPIVSGYEEVSDRDEPSKGEDEWRQKYYDLSEKLKRRKESKCRARIEEDFSSDTDSSEDDSNYSIFKKGLGQIKSMKFTGDSAEFEVVKTRVESILQNRSIAKISGETWSITGYQLC